MTPLNRVASLPAGVAPPGAVPQRAAILHLGPGAFFRAHLAAYTDSAGDGWGIEVAGLRSGEVAQAFSAQQGLYTLLTRDSTGTRARVVGSVLGGIAPATILARLADPAIRIVSLTITEKAYGLAVAGGGLNLQHPDIAADLTGAGAPRSAVGVLVAGLAARRAAGQAPFTPLSCDNLPGNGAVLRRLVLDFAALRDPGLAEWIAAHVTFPATMVDRITPAPTADTLADAARLTGHADALAVETEPFSQWVIEDHFAAGRPAWDRAGALFVQDVTLYEQMKLRMLNGTHSLLAYLGFMAGHAFVRDAIADPQIGAAARRHLRVAAGTLGPVPGVDLDTYAEDLLARFANRAIAHQTYQIAMDGSQKLPQRVFDPAVELLARGQDAESYALITAGWMHYATGIGPGGQPHGLRDPREAEIRAALAATGSTAAQIVAALLALPALVPAALAHHPQWCGQLEAHLERLLGQRGA